MISTKRDTSTKCTKLYLMFWEKFYKDLPRIKEDWERYKDKFDSIKNWSQFDSMTDETLERNYMDQNVINKLRKMVNEKT